MSFKSNCDITNLINFCNTNLKSKYSRDKVSFMRKINICTDRYGIFTDIKAIIKEIVFLRILIG